MTYQMNHDDLCKIPMIQASSEELRVSNRKKGEEKVKSCNRGRRISLQDMEKSSADC